MNEHGTQNRIRNALAGALLLFRANVGRGWTGNAEKIARAGMVQVAPGDVVIRRARPFDTGLPKGFSDLFGLMPITITADMVGTKIAQFAALEVKAATGRASAPQVAFLKAVRDSGGIAEIVRDEDEARKALGL